MATISLTGYTDQVSVRPGETVDIKISAENATAALVEIVRIIHGDEHPDGPGFIGCWPGNPAWPDLSRWRPMPLAPCWRGLVVAAQAAA